MARLPAIFFGHGNPMNALESNAYLLYVLGARHSADVASFPVEGIDGGSVSMMTVALV